MEPTQPTSANYCSAALDEATLGICQDIVAWQQAGITAQTDDRIERILVAGMSHVHKKVSASADRPQVYESTARQTSHDGYKTAIAELQKANRLAESGRADAFEPFDPGVFLESYESALSYYSVGCGMILTPDESGRIDMNTAWLEPLSGADNCALLLEMDKEVGRLVETTQFVPSLEREVEAKDSPHHLSLSTAFGPNWLRQKVELADYEVDYFSTRASLGYHYDLRGLGLSGLLAGAGPVVELGYSYVGGDIGNLGSHRHLGTIALGWRQDFLPHDQVFVEPQAGLGWGANWLNFGRGYPLEQEGALVGTLATRAGYEFDLGALSLEVSAGYYFESTLAGEIDYVNHGPSAGMGVSN